MPTHKTTVNRRRKQNALGNAGVLQGQSKARYNCFEVKQEEEMGENSLMITRENTTVRGKRKTKRPYHR